MKIDDTTLLWLLRESISVMEDRATELKYGQIMSGPKYLCVILKCLYRDFFNDGEIFRDHLFESIVCRRIKEETFSNYLWETDFTYRTMRNQYGENSNQALTYEMQKKIEFVKDWIKELEAKEVV